MLKTEVLDIEKVRADFPILKRKVHGKRLVYLDNAATTQKPKAVIDALVDYYSRYNSNVHRSVHTLGEEATAAYESARGTHRKVRGLVCEAAGLRQGDDRGDQPRQVRLGGHQRPEGGPDRDHPDGAPQQHRPLAAPCEEQGATLKFVGTSPGRDHRHGPARRPSQAVS